MFCAIVGAYLRCSILLSRGSLPDLAPITIWATKVPYVVHVVLPSVIVQVDEAASDLGQGHRMFQTVAVVTYTRRQQRDQDVVYSSEAKAKVKAGCCGSRTVYAHQNLTKTNVSYDRGSMVTRIQIEVRGQSKPFS